MTKHERSKLITAYIDANKSGNKVYFSDFLTVHAEEVKRLSKNLKKIRKLWTNGFILIATEKKVEYDVETNVEWTRVENDIEASLNNSPLNTSEGQTKKSGRIVYFNHENISYERMTWAVDSDDMSEKLMLYRMQTINAAKDAKKLTTNQFLILNYIINFDSELTIINELGIAYKAKQVKKQLRRNHAVSRSSSQIILLCNELLQKAKLQENEEEEEEEDLMVFLLLEKIKAKKEKDDEKLLFLSLFEHFQNIISNTSITTEQSYIDSTLLPFFEHIFNKIAQTEHFAARGRLEKPPSDFDLLLPLGLSKPSSSSSTSTATTSATATATATSSAASKRDFSSSSSSSYRSWLALLPDYLVKAVFTGIKFDLLAVEVKKPKAKFSQIVNDESKVAVLMKLMINRLVQNSIPSPVVCGFVDNGDFIKTYKMSLTSNGSYSFVELACFPSIRCLNSLACLPVMIEHMNQLKNIICEMIEVIRITLLGEKLPGPLSVPSAVPVEWLRPSFEYPYLDTSNKKRK
ncbi:uncharacterized protein B0P05DRAFT_573276 [Gilbertella persicaria]|uniref:uncharacterized protein n=1 Tax=Gilbertella persicaria TaxID=101096 RepID=UPI002220540A|nr:uncharacterized protein B0P05DRAFT_573276 [Gilbertella persicaria]KAI8070545.1 hypothetical protein B0P05DRAFT_573276 [Gilbertella persicaria]